MSNKIKNNGQVFTPDYLVKNILDEAGYYGENILQKHCMENSCGSGAFLCEIIKRYYNEYVAFYHTANGVEEHLSQYIHAIEIDNYIFNVDLQKNLKNLCKSLHLKEVDFDIRHADTLTVSDYDNKMDFVVGNPPYVRVHNLNEGYNTVKKYAFATGGMTDLYLVFFEIGFRMLKEGGHLCYITPSSWLNSVAGANLRDYIRKNRNLISLIDLAHYQAFRVTTYTLISHFRKGINTDNFAYYEYDIENRDKKYIETLCINEIDINGYFYLAYRKTLNQLREIIMNRGLKLAVVKNGFATLSDKVFIAQDFPFTQHVIPAIKASTGKWYKAFFPYDTKGKPLDKEKIFNNQDIAEYLYLHKENLLKGQKEGSNPQWYLYGRTQALKDVYVNKISINTCIKDVSSIKINHVPRGCGLYSGLYILTNADIDTITKILYNEDFIKYISSLKKYKSGGYYTFNSKDIELYLNYHLNILQTNGSITIKSINKQGISQCNQTLF